MSQAQKITPFLWFDSQAEEAAQFYTTVFENSRMRNITRYSESVAQVASRPAGSAMTVAFTLAGQDFTAINGGPQFEFTPAVSFFVSCADVAETKRIFELLAEQGTVLMPLQEYPFSERFGWTQDRYGVSWQINAAPRPQKIAPSLMFVGEQSGRAEEAMKFYTSLFADSRIEEIWRFGPEDKPQDEGTVKQAIFSLAGQDFRAMDGGMNHAFGFSGGISLLVDCDTQEEIDRLWNPLTQGADPAAQQCGWLKDRFGVVWQVVPNVLPKMLSDPDSQKVERVTQAFLKMKKFEIGGLQRAYEGTGL